MPADNEGVMISRRSLADLRMTHKLVRRYLPPQQFERRRRILTAPVECRVARIYGGDIAPGAFTGQAKLWEWDEDESEFVEAEGDPVDVYDFMGSGVPDEMPVHLLLVDGRWEIEWPMRLTGKLEANLSVGGSATVGIWRHNGTSWVDTGMNITAYDWLMPTGASNIASGRTVEIQFYPHSNRWLVDNAQCPDIAPPP